MRIIFDTNTWISALIKPPFYQRIKNIVALQDVEVLCSGKIYEELKDTKQKRKLLKYFTPKNVDDLIKQLRTIAELVPVRSIVEICRDPKDNFLLALAKDGNADYLITDDDDLLVLKNFGKTKIVTITEFENTI